MTRPCSRFYYDPELAAFVQAGFNDRLIYAAIKAKCRERFGPDRTPSVSAIGRFYQSIQANPAAGATYPRNS
jgi:hypothetical protein